MTRWEKIKWQLDEWGDPQIVGFIVLASLFGYGVWIVIEALIKRFF
tara:strand:+ start:300 stop:437 length:138 start_codon:yes stop_codon:yes gene_type:complete